MTVGELKKLISEVPDEVKILNPSTDHSLVEVDLVLSTALKSDEWNYTEDYGEEMTPEKDYGKRVQALVVSRLCYMKK